MGAKLHVTADVADTFRSYYTGLYNLKPPLQGSQLDHKLTDIDSYLTSVTYTYDERERLTCPIYNCRGTSLSYLNNSKQQGTWTRWSYDILL